MDPCKKHFNELAKASYFNFVINDKDALYAMYKLYQEDTGDTYQLPTTELEKMIDDASGASQEFAKRFYEWFSNDWEKGFLGNVSITS